MSAADYAPPAAVLKGVTPTEIAAVDALHARYRRADWAQRDQKKTAEQLLAETEPRSPADPQPPAGATWQGAADQAWTHRDPRHAAQRKAIGLQPDKPRNIQPTPGDSPLRLSPLSGTIPRMGSQITSCASEVNLIRRKIPAPFRLILRTPLSPTSS